MISLVRSIGDALTYLVFGGPKVCALCGTRLESVGNQPFTGICRVCRKELRSQTGSVCQVCGMPVKPPLHLCKDCSRHLYYFDGQRSCGLYDGKLRSAVIRLKQYGERWLARPLGALMAEEALAFPGVDLVVPVPADPSRLKERGFNQAKDLSQVVSERLGVMHMDILHRRKGALHQTGLGRHKRWENLKGSMIPKKQLDLRGLTVLVVDDVVTTGATLDEAARTLKALGAEKVYGVSLARTAYY